MTFWEIFFRLLVRRPKPALAALYWQLTRRKVRARNRLRVASADLPFAYAMWIAANERESDFAPEAIIDTWSSRPSFTVVLHSAATHAVAQRRRSIESLERQIYPHWTFLEVADEQIGQAVIAADGNFIVPLRAGDVLSTRALFRFAEVVQANRDAAILYGDQDRIDERGRRSRPWFKPQWNEELFLAQDYLSASVAIETALARDSAAQSGGELASLLLAATGKAGKIVHVPHVLVHVAGDRDPDPRRVQAVAEHLRPRGATCSAGPHGTVKVKWPLPGALPLVSVIIPTKDKLELLRPCVESVLERTDYPNFEMLIVDNGSVESRTAEFLVRIGSDPRVRVLRYDRPFNYSAINNFAVGHAAGSYVCLLNNDTEVIEPAWLSELMRYAVRPEIGAAGGKLLYEDRSIQHAGVVVGIGDAAGHAHRFLADGDPGYFRMPHVAQFVSAVTGACLLVEKTKFLNVGGLDEENLAVAFNDVDLCLKLEKAGWRNVYVPHAVLVHHESKSRGSDMEPGQLERYRRELKVLQERWGTGTYADPLHNPNLDRYSETFVLRL